MNKILKNSKISNILFNIIIFFCTYFTIGVNFETVDDITVSKIYTTGEFSVFSLRIIAYISNFLNKIFININGYGLLFVFLIFYSSIFITNKILQVQDRKTKLIKIIIYSILLITCYYQLQFTTVSIFTSSIGILLLDSFLNNKNKKDLFMSIPLIFLGIAIRKETIILLIPLILLLIIFKGNNKKDYCKKSIIYILIIIASFSCWKIDRMTYPENYKSYREYNIARSNIFDFLAPGNEKNFLNDTDFEMLQYQLLGDDNYFTLDKLNSIYNESSNKIEKPKLFFTTLFCSTLKAISQHFSIIFFLLLLTYEYKKNKKNYLEKIFLILIYFGYIIGYSFINRYMDRIMFASLIPILIYLLDKNININVKKAIPLLIGVFVISGIRLYQDEEHHTKILNNYNELNEIISQEPNNLYYHTLGSLIYTSKQIPALDKETKKLYQNDMVVYWTAQHPTLLKQMKDNNINNAITDLTEKENYYLITVNNDREINILKHYFKEVYNKEIENEIMKVNDYWAIMKLKQKDAILK